jgi:EAL domain-containing protein (putative c-di-GMP-specific phosphodiesterase class I)
MLVDLLSLIKREDLMAVFNVNINSKYSIVKPLLKQIKSYAQLGFKNIGSGYINFIDIYALKVEYLEIDEKLSELVDKEEEWKFLVDSVKLIIKAQKSKLISSKYKDENIKKISNEIKIL